MLSSLTLQLLAFATEGSGQEKLKIFPQEFFYSGGLFCSSRQKV